MKCVSLYQVASSGEVADCKQLHVMSPQVTTLYTEQEKLQQPVLDNKVPAGTSKMIVIKLGQTSSILGERGVFFNKCFDQS